MGNAHSFQFPPPPTPKGPGIKGEELPIIPQSWTDQRKMQPKNGQMLGPNKNQHKSALWLTHPAMAGVGQQAVGGLGVWRMQSPRQEAAMDAQILEHWTQVGEKVESKRGVGSLPGLGQKQNPGKVSQESLGDNRNTQPIHQVAYATKRLGQNQAKVHVFGCDDPSVG